MKSIKATEYLDNIAKSNDFTKNEKEAIGLSCIIGVNLAEQEMIEKAIEAFKDTCSSIYKGVICIKKVGKGMNLCNCDCDKGKEFIKLLNQNE